MESLLSPPIVMYSNANSVTVKYNNVFNEDLNFPCILNNENFSYLTLAIVSLLPVFANKLKIVEIENLKEDLKKNILEYANLLSNLRFLDSELLNLISNIKDDDCKILIETFQFYPKIGLIYNPPLKVEEISKIKMVMKKLPNKTRKLLEKLILYSSTFNKLFEERGKVIESANVINVNEEYYCEEGYQTNIFCISKLNEKENLKTYYYVKVNKQFMDLIPALWCLTTFLEINVPNNNLIFGTGFLDRIIESRINIAKDFLNRYLFEIPKKVFEKISIAASLGSIGMLKLTPLLLDQNVEEIYVDAPRKNIYLDHSEWGRCETNLSLNEEDIERLATYLKVESGLQFDYNTPSLKTDLNTSFFKLRVTIDMHPLISEKYSLIIRKFKNRPLTIIDLINNGTISIDAAAYLLISLIHRCNILVVGEPSTGKTTLINALDIMTPSYWRKISVEDVIESLDLARYGKHQVKYRVDPFEKDVNNRKRIVETIKLLHRSPNYIFFGELLTPEHVSIFLQSLEAGLHGIQTTHASSPESIIRRWNLHYKIPIQSLEHINVIVHMKREISYNINRRFVYRIVEPILKFENNSYRVELINMFSYDGECKKLIQVRNIKESNVLKRIAEEEGMSIEEICQEVMECKKFLTEILSSENCEVSYLSYLFDKKVCGKEKR